MDNKMKELIKELYELTLDDTQESDSRHKGIKVSDIEIGQKIQLGDYTWSAYAKDDSGNVRFLLNKEYEISDIIFSSNNNNYITSNARKVANTCNPSSQALNILGSDSFIQQSINLFSHDGLSDYGICEGDLFAVMTYDTYRKNRKNIDISEMWLSTPDSTPSGYSDGYVRYVGSCGGVGYGDYNCDGGVRPDFILKSSIFVSVF